jgi:hypothetical protein
VLNILKCVITAFYLRKTLCTCTQCTDSDLLPNVTQQALQPFL